MVVRVDFGPVFVLAAVVGAALSAEAPASLPLGFAVFLGSEEPRELIVTGTFTQSRLG